MRSGWKRSNWSSFSPVDANRIGLPVTALTDSAAPPRASPSSLDMTTPSNCDGLGELLGDVDGVLAGHRVDDEQDVACGLTALRIFASSSISSSSTCRRPRGVDDQDVLAVASWPGRAPSGDLDRVLVGALLVDVAPAWPPTLTSCSTAAGPVDVAGGDARPTSRAPRAGSARAWPWRSSCPSPAGRPCRITVGGRGENAIAGRRAAHQRVSSSSTILTTCWPGLSCLEHLGAEAALLDRGRELLDDLEVDVGLEQREADLAHRRVDVVLGQRAAAADAGEGRLELLGEGVEHSRAARVPAGRAAGRRLLPGRPPTAGGV